MNMSAELWRVKARAFTLIELLLVLLISSLIVLGINAAYHQAHLIWAACEEPRPAYHDARLITETLRQEFSGLYFPPAPDANEAEGGGEPFEPISIAEGGITFYTLTPSWKTQLPASRPARVRYTLIQDPSTEQNVLQRFELPCSGEKPIGKESSEIVAKGLSAFSVSAIGDDRQAGHQSSEGNGDNQQGAPPKAIKVSLMWPAADNAPQLSFETTILVPSQAPLTP
jgi:prepilin-type N-terminal cleavage/methylation domain-containing protein